MRAHWSELPRHFDVIVVGAGSSGAVVASRLSENGHCRVLLLEAGPELPADERMRRAIGNANQAAVVPGLNWKLRTAIKGGAASTAGAAAKSSPGATVFDYEAGKVVGGSSAINAVQALRGEPIDYDEWAADCGADWGWSSVLPYFRLLEDDPAGCEKLHGRGGPMPVRRESRAELTPLQAALMEACTSYGFPLVDDHNDPVTSGVGIIPKNAVGGVRMSTALTYLAQAAERPNLSVLAEAHVHRVLWKDDRHCSGVEVEVGGEMVSFLADHVFLCAGAIHSPTLLMRSGVGSPARLEPLGIRTRVSLRGVGENLMDHPVVGIWGYPKSGACQVGEPLRQTLLRCSSGVSNYVNDLHICLMGGMDIGEMFPRLSAVFGTAPMAGVTACFTKSTSRGHVRLLTADPAGKPEVVINCLGDPTDIAPLKEGVRIAWRLLQQGALCSMFERILAWTEGMVTSDLALERAVAAFVRPSAHLCGSAKMGMEPDAGAVVTPRGQVYGVNNLWVADASVMPRIPSAPTNFTTLMVAEKLVADFRSKA